MSPRRYLEDFTVGQKFGSGRLTVEPDAIARFAAEFDPQPFHLGESTARRPLSDLTRTVEMTRPRIPSVRHYIHRQLFCSGADG